MIVIAEVYGAYVRRQRAIVVADIARWLAREARSPHARTVALNVLASAEARWALLDRPLLPR